MKWIHKNGCRFVCSRLPPTFDNESELMSKLLSGGVLYMFFAR